MMPGIFFFFFFPPPPQEEEVAAAIDRLAFRDNNQGG